MKILCIGINHETAPVAVRERLALDAKSRARTLRWLADQPGVQEALLLSTCNRVELYLVTDEDSFREETVLAELFRAHVGLDDSGWRECLYRYSYHGAVSHLFRVTSGMDSMVIGEPQITGQVKEAYRTALQQKTVGLILNRLLHRSFTVSKRVRTETELAARAVSVSYVAVELARKIFGELSDRTALLAGAGEMAELAARHLAAHGARKILVASRTWENALRLASGFGGEALRLDEIPAVLDRIDILICSTAAPDYILRADQVREALRSRRYNPIFIIDIAVPRNIDPRVDELENVFLYDMDDLQQVLKTNMEERRKELKRAEAIVQEELRHFLHWLDTLDMVPTIVSLRRRAEELRRQELDKALSLLKPPLTQEQRQTVDAMSQAIVNKILHGPITEMKRVERQGDASGLVHAVRRLFSLQSDEG